MTGDNSPPTTFYKDISLPKKYDYPNLLGGVYLFLFRDFRGMTFCGTGIYSDQ